MNVLSLFDGMSCGRIALDQLGIKVDNYYACEIDKYAMQVSQANYPEIIQLGDVCDVKSEDLPKIDLILAGSPCQGFSFAGKQLAFDDPRSALFFEFIRLLKECKPKYFLLENVRMKKEYLQVISEQVSACYPEIPFGIEPTMICSSLVSAQSRKRYYWTNIPNITQPEQKGIVLRDILETRVNQDRLSYMTNQDDSSHSPIQVGIATDINGHDILKRVYSEDGKSPTVNTCQGGNREPKVVVDNKKPNQINPSKKANGVQPYIQDRVFHVDGKSHCLTREFASRTNVGDVVVDVRAMTEVRTPEANQIRYEHKRKTGKDWPPRHMRHLVERDDEKMNTLTSAITKQHILQITKDPDQEVYWRKLTPLECERLQTVPDNYTDHVSNSQRFKMLGNGWTIAVIKHIFKNMERV